MQAMVLNEIIPYAVMIPATILMMRQCRKPASLPGRAFLWIMNRSHAGVTDWGLEHVSIGKDFTVLDIGCGGGRTVQTLAEAASAGKVFGIDYSAESVASSRRLNSRLIEGGRVEIQQGSVSALPWSDDTFDLITAVETHYYWPNGLDDMREVKRVLKPGGHFLIIAETHKGGLANIVYSPAMLLLGAKYMTLEEHRNLLTSAGFSDIEVFDKPGGWMCAVGMKSPAVPIKP
jgi:SAM-dependent methyltransferase